LGIFSVLLIILAIGFAVGAGRGEAAVEWETALDSSYSSSSSYSAYFPLQATTDGGVAFVGWTDDGVAKITKLGAGGAVAWETALDSYDYSPSSHSYQTSFLATTDGGVVFADHTGDGVIKITKLGAGDTPDGTKIIGISLNGDTLTITTTEGVEIYDLTQTPISINYSESKFVPSTTHRGEIILEGTSRLFPSGTKLIITVRGSAGLVSAASIRPAVEPYQEDFEVTVEDIDEKSVLTIPTESLPTGVYDISFKSPEGSNPYFSGNLASNYSYTASETPGTPGDNRSDGSSGVGGCAAGNLLFAIPLLGALFVLSAKRR
jgi:hypothetical protein